MRSLFDSVTMVSSNFKEAVAWWVKSAMEGFETGFCFTLIKRTVIAAFTCTFALGGAVVGIVLGAMKGQTTETGLVRGSGIGAVAGAITAVQLLDSFTNGEPLSKVALLYSLVNGKVFMEWVSPAVLKAYQFQVNAMESTYNEIADIYETTGVNGLSQNCIRKLLEFTFQCEEVAEPCSICLQDLKDGELMRKVGSCGHYFHSECIDKWLIRNGSCPICRNSISDRIVNKQENGI